MDPQTIQALMGVFQQGLQILQQAQTGGGAPGADAGDMGGGMPADGGGDDDMYQQDGGNDAPDGMDDDASDMGDDDGMGSSGSLHDRVSQLEDHTGLKKSATASTLPERLDALESEILGQEYEGPVVARVQQLEKALGTEAKESSDKPSDNDAPQEIPLDTLIKTAIQSGIQEGLAKIQSPSTNDLPDPESMRKAARRNGANHYNQPRRQATTMQGDEDLTKAAIACGWSDEDLDQEVTLGDMLLVQYHAQQAGSDIPMFGDDDDE